MRPERGSVRAGGAEAAGRPAVAPARARTGVRHGHRVLPDRNTTGLPRAEGRLGAGLRDGSGTGREGDRTGGGREREGDGRGTGAGPDPGGPGRTRAVHFRSALPWNIRSPCRHAPGPTGCETTRPS
ncbi:hypothetical protein SCWH03_42110 [Streptomyces pacificus]|uniref:Uncharacterized protein n=1 Tax=Streptomyces pacificus TaxID=2705029 RepID=A0A6A0B055_9ACTN|nr:hypothetical protein SCWH03_42110 [Streptomyces pacificus]